MLWFSQNKLIFEHPSFQPSSFSINIIILPNPLPLTLLHVTIFYIFPTFPSFNVLVIITDPNAIIEFVYLFIPTI